MKIHFLPFLKNPPQPWNTQNWEGEKTIKYKKTAAFSFPRATAQARAGVRGEDLDWRFKF